MKNTEIQTLKLESGKSYKIQIEGLAEGLNNELTLTPEAILMLHYWLNDKILRERLKDMADAICFFVDQSTVLSTDEQPEFVENIQIVTMVYQDLKKLIK